MTIRLRSRPFPSLLTLFLLFPMLQLYVYNGTYNMVSVPVEHISILAGGAHQRREQGASYVPDRGLRTRLTALVSFAPTVICCVDVPSFSCQASTV
jgi:hypothetical protein